MEVRMETNHPLNISNWNLMQERRPYGIHEKKTTTTRRSVPQHITDCGYKAKKLKKNHLLPLKTHDF